MPVRRPTARTNPQRKAPRLKLDYDVPYFGGLDTTSDPTGLDDTMSPDCLNVVYDIIQSVGTRKGYTKLLTTKLPGSVLGMYSLYQSNGSKQLIYAADANLYKYNNAGGSTQLTGTPTNFTANQQWDFDEYMDSVYGGNSKDGLIAYNGNNYNVANAGISPQFVKIHKNRVYCANQNSSTLYFSDAGDPTSFPVNNFIQINTNDGQNITALAEMLDNLIVFKDESVWILTGDPVGAGNLTTIGNLQLRQANSPVGCSAFRTVRKIDQTLIFMHYSGIYYLQNYTVKPLSAPTMNKTFLEDMNPGYLQYAWGLYSASQKRYYMGYPSAASTVCDHIMTFDFMVNQFAIWDDMPGSCAVEFKFSGVQPTILMGDPSQGNIYELNQGYADIYGDNGSATAGSSTTLTDTTKSWTTNALVDAKVYILSGTGAGSVGTITANTSDQITVSSWSGTAPAAGSVYSVGAYDSYWTTKWFDFEMTGYVKAYKYFNLFIDAEDYPIQFGSAIDFQPLAYQKNINLTSGALTWGQSGLVWGPSSGTWGSYSSEFVQANIAGQGRYIRYIFGNNKANQPWRAMKHSTTYKLKKERPNILST